MANIGTVEGVLRLRDEFSTVLTRASTQMAQAGAKMQATGKAMTATGRSMTTGITLPLIGIGAAVFKMSSDFSMSLTRIETLVGVQRDQVQGWRKDIMALAGETGRAPRELADAMFFITSAGLRGSDALEALQASAQASALGLGETASVADAATSAMNAYGADVLSASEATNILALAVREGKLEASELAPVMGRLLPTASAMGVAFEDVAGVLAVMSRTGLDAAEASTSLGAIMSTLLKPTNGAVEALDSVGLKLSDLREIAKGPGGIVEVMRLLAEKFEGNDEALTQVVPNLRAFRGMMNVLAQDASIVDAVMAGVASGVDVLGDGMKRLAEEPGFKFQQFLATAKARLIEMGDVLVPTFEAILEAAQGLVEWAADAIGWFQRLPAPVQRFSIALTGLVIAAGPALLILGKIVSTLGALALQGPRVVSALKFMISPWGLVAAAIATAVTIANRWIEAQRKLLETTLSNVVSTNDYGKIINALRVEIGQAAAEQRGFNAEIVQAAKDILPALRSDLESARSELEKLGKTSGEASEEFREQADHIADLESKLKAAEKYLAKTGVGMEGLGESAAQAAEETAALAEQTADVEDAMKAAEAAVADYEEQIRQHSADIRELREANEEWAEEVREEVVEAYEEAVAVAQMNTDAMRAMMRAEYELSETEKKLTILVEEGADALAQYEDRLKAKAIAAANNKRDDEEYINTLAELITAQREATEELDHMAEASGDLREAFSEAIATMVLEADNLGEALHAIFAGRAKQAFTEFIDNMVEGFADGVERGHGAFKSLAVTWKETAKSMGTTANAITAAFAAAAGEWEDVAISALTAIAAFASGNWVGGIIGTIGAVVGAFKQLFGDKEKPHSERIQEMFEAMEVGALTLEKVADAAYALLAAFRDVGTEAMDLHGAQELLNENFDALADAAEKMGGTAVDALANVVAAAQAAGLNMEVVEERLAETIDKVTDAIAERTQFLLDSSEMAVASIEAMFSSMARITARDVAFAAETVMQAWQAMVAAGMSVVEIAQQLADVFALIQERGEEIGLELPKEFKRLGDIIEILARDKVTAAIDKLNAMAAAAQAVGDMGLLTAEQFDALGDSVDRAFNLLKRQGLSGAEALAVLAPQLQLLNDLAQQYGFELDAHTQKLLDQAIAQGLVTDKGLTMEDILIQGFDRMIEALNQVIIALGGVPVVFEEIGASAEQTAEQIEDSMTTAADTTIDVWEEANDAMLEDAIKAAEGTVDAWKDAASGLPHVVSDAVGRMTRALQGIPITFSVGGEFRVVAAQMGTSGFYDFGRGTPAVLHGREQVITEAQGQGIAQMVAAAIRNSRGSSREHEQTLLLLQRIAGGIERLETRRPDY